MEAPITVAEAIMAIKSHKYLLPAIQRDFVWSADKTIALFDSLMRGYPVGSFLFWRVDAATSTSYAFYEFMQHFDAKDHSRLKPHDIPTPRELMVALDGQQRLTSLAIGILGYRADRIRGKHANNPNAYPKKRLHLNLAAPHHGEDDLDRVYDFRFLTEAEAATADTSFRWFPVREVLQFMQGDGAVNLGKVVSYVSKMKLEEFGADALSRLCEVVLKDPVIHYFREDEQSLDRVLNVFVRLNSGGVALSYSDLLLSIASAQWESDAREAIYGLVDDLNAQGDGFEFDKDFVLKSALVLSDLPDIGFSVENFGKKNTETIESGWETNVRAPLLLAVEVAAALGYHGKTLTSGNVLIPLAYYLRKIGSPAGLATAPKHAMQRVQIRNWLIASLLKSVFSSKTDTVLSAVRTAIRESDASLFPMKDIEAALNKHGVSLKFTDVELEGLLEAEYGKRNAFSVLAALYPGLNTQFRFHMDHVFPKAGFHKNKLRAAGLDEAAIERVQGMFNQIPNLQFLEGLTNQAKLDATYESWIAPLQAKPADWAQYRAQHLVPEMSAYDLHSFEEFFAQRRELMLENLREKLTSLSEVDEQETV
ncbi:MAG: DUF262 domain-containing protein [Comamonadaceae bacterium]|nr:DUF262 domain-containing protein [Comamonadaceae bacterium]